MNLVTVSQFAERLAVCDETVRRCIRAGLIVAHKQGKRWMIEESYSLKSLQYATSRAAAKGIGIYTVYFIQSECGGPIKIGVTENVPRRLADLQACCPIKLVIRSVIPNVPKVKEAELHELFAADRLHGEWFRPSPALLHYIREFGCLIPPA